MASKGRRKCVNVSYDSGSDGDIESEEDTSFTEITKAKRKCKPKVTEENEDRDEYLDAINVGEGWADAMAKILSKSVTNEQSAVLAKSKSYEKEKKKDKADYEQKKKLRDAKKAREDISYSKPNIQQKEIERALQRTATRGVVQLFNAVKKEQKTLESKLTEVGASERKRAKVEASMSKGQFLSLLNKSASKTQQTNGGKVLQNSSKKSSATWDVLRDNFMMGATMKDWDKESESGSEDNERT